MPTGFTADVADGKDLDVNHFILKTARGLGLFAGARDTDFDIIKTTREQLVKIISSDTSYYAKSVAEHQAQIETAKRLLKGAQLETELEKINKDLAYDQESLANENRYNLVRSELVGALIDNLPGGKVTDKKRGTFAPKRPNEFAELFGAKVAATDDRKTNAQTELALLQEIIATIQSMSDKQKAKLLGKKIGYEQKSHEYDVATDTAKRMRYDGMIAHITEWQPEYENDQDKDLEKEVREYFAGHKKFMLSQLDESKKFDCHNADWQARKQKEHEQRVKTLQGTEPADFADMLQYQVTNRANNVQRAMAKKDPKLQDGDE